MQQRSAEWFEARKGRVTGSVAGAILGLAPYMTRDEVMRSMVRSYHGAERDFVGNIATEYGQRNEPTAIQELGMYYDISVEECGFFPYEDWLGASPDGLIGDEAIVEVKCPYGKRDSKDFKPLSEQPHYYAQIQIELLCTGRKLCYFFQWSPVGDMLELVELDQVWLDENLPILKAFHNEYLLEVDNPDHLAPLRKELYGPKASALLEEYDDLTDAIERATERRKEVLAELVKAAKERDAIINGRKLTLVRKEGAISYAKAIKELAPDADLEKWRGKASEYWRLS